MGVRTGASCCAQLATNKDTRDDISAISLFIATLLSRSFRGAFAVIPPIIDQHVEAIERLDMGLAGTVDLRTIRPLEYGKRAFAVNLRGQLDSGGGRNDDYSKYGWRGSVSYIDQNDDGTLGWMVSYAHLNAPSHINETKNWFYGDYGTGSQILSGDEIRASNARDIRDGITGTVEWKPSDAVHSVLDLYYSRFKQDNTTRGTEFFSSAWVDGVTYTNEEIEDHGGVPFQTFAHVTNVAPILRWNDNKRTDHLFSVGLNNDFRLAERTHLLADLSYSSNKRDESDTELFGGYGCCGTSNFGMPTIPTKKGSGAICSRSQRLSSIHGLASIAMACPAESR